MDISLKFAWKEKPDLTGVPIPDSAENILNRCFNYVPQERPTAKELFTFFKEVDKNAKYI